MSHIFAISCAFLTLVLPINPNFDLRLKEPKNIVICPGVQKFHVLLLLTTCPIWEIFPHPL